MSVVASANEALHAEILAALERGVVRVRDGAASGGMRAALD